MDPKQDSKATPSKDDKKRIRLHYIKGSHFRVIHTDGVIGGPSPNGRGIHMSLWSERAPIPLQVSHEIDDEGHVGKEVERVQRDGIVREVEADVVISLETAEAMIEWLKHHVKSLKGLAKKTSQGQRDGSS